MAEITAQMVMDLRQKTGAKMMDAKRALVDSDGNFDKAVELLREKGQADAAKRTHRATAEGLIVVVLNPEHTAAALAEVNCETDFVAKTDQFKQLGTELAEWVLQQPAEAVTADELPADQRAKVENTVSKTGENVQFRRGIKLSTEKGAVESYIHLGGKIGVLVQVDGDNADAARTLAKDLSMQVAASSPEYLTMQDVPEAIIEKEMEIYRVQARNEGKKEEFLDRIAQGRLEKFFKDNCLVEQPFIKDSDKSVKTLLAEASKAAGASLTIKRFVRFQLGQ